MIPSQPEPLESGRITQQRRLGSSVRPLFDRNTVILDATNDRDGDTSCVVNLLAPTSAHSAPREKRRARRTLVNTLHEATEPRRLAEWISARTGMPLSDETASLAKPPDLRAVAQQLESTGRFGRWIAKVLRRWQNQG